MKRAFLLTLMVAAICLPLAATAFSPYKDAQGFWHFDKGVLKPFDPTSPTSLPNVFCIEVARKPLVDDYGQPIIDQTTGLQAWEYDWTQSGFMWRKPPSSVKVIVQSAELKKIHGPRKGACGLVWGNEVILQQGSKVATSCINLCWPLLYETDGTEFILTIVYHCTPGIRDFSGRTARIHQEKYHWRVEWAASDFSNFRQRLLYFARLPAGQCELFAVPPFELQKILWLLDQKGSAQLGTLDLGVTGWLAKWAAETDPVKKILWWNKACDKAAALERLLDDDSCQDPCLVCPGAPCPGPCPNAWGIVNSDQLPVGSVLLTDWWLAATARGLLLD